jgi:dUTP pyrophosphatase
MPKVLFKRLRPDAIIPEYATPGASGMDVASPVDVTIEAGETVMIKLGFAAAVSEGYELQVRPRSGLSLKTKLRLPNAPGTIDSDYRGEIGVLIENTSPQLRVHECLFAALDGSTEALCRINRGDRIAQLVLCPVARAELVEVDELPDTQRGTGGFGSTGK